MCMTLVNGLYSAIREGNISEIRTAPQGKFRLVGYSGEVYECWNAGDFASYIEALKASRTMPAGSVPFYRVHDDRGEWISGNA